MNTFSIISTEISPNAGFIRSHLHGSTTDEVQAQAIYQGVIDNEMKYWPEGRDVSEMRCVLTEDKIKHGSLTGKRRRLIIEILTCEVKA